jgi:predicted acylesterase/phospholipase RssA
MSSIPREHFYRIQGIRDLDRVLLGARETTQAAALTSAHWDILHYALHVARTSLLRHRARDVDLFEQIAPFRHWLLEQLAWFVDVPREQVRDWPGLRNLVPMIGAQVQQVRSEVLLRHADAFPEERWEQEMTERALVLVLGGGGGAGYSHLGVFSILDELGIVPRMIAGSSMGALLGLIRSVQRSYDASMVAMALPRPSELGRVFSPYRGFSRYGFPGTLELNARTVGTQVFQQLMRSDVPRVSELPIAFRPIATGLRSGIGLALSDVETYIERSAGRGSAFTTPGRASLFSRLVKTMVLNPELLSEVVFGSDPFVQDFNAIDAVGFSCAVPGIIHYDLYQPGDPGAPALRQLFDSRGIFRLTDGGVVSNVPSRAAWHCVQRGEILTRNTWTLSCDAFAPQVGNNVLFYPIQRLARTLVEPQLKYSDLHVTFRRNPSPVGVLQSIHGLEAAVSASRHQLQRHRATIRNALRRLPAWPVLNQTLDAP